MSLPDFSLCKEQTEVERLKSFHVKNQLLHFSAKKSNKQKKKRLITALLNPQLPPQGQGLDPQQSLVKKVSACKGKAI